METTTPTANTTDKNVSLTIGGPKEDSEATAAMEARMERLRNSAQNTITQQEFANFQMETLKLIEQLREQTAKLMLNLTNQQDEIGLLKAEKLKEAEKIEVSILPRMMTHALVTSQ